MNLTLVSVSRKPEHLDLDFPFYCLVEPSSFNRYDDVLAESEYLAEKRNRAIEKAIKQFPDTTHIFYLDSYYLSQSYSIQNLIQTYEQINDPSLILGAPIWLYRKNRLIDNRPRFYDSWGCPELLDYRPYHVDKLPRLVQVSSIGNVVIFPLMAWRKIGFHVPTPFPGAGSPFTRFCQQSQSPVFVDFGSPFYRNKSNSAEAEYDFPKRFRTTVGHFKFLIVSRQLRTPK